MMKEDIAGLKLHTNYGMNKAELSLWMLLAMIGGASLIGVITFVRRRKT